jgi:hypothetical protein
VDVKPSANGAARWAVAWICSLAISTSLAYGLTEALQRGPVDRVAQSSITATRMSADSRTAVLERCIVSVGDPIYAGVDMDSSIVAKSRLEMCDRVVPDQS